MQNRGGEGGGGWKVMRQNWGTVGGCAEYNLHGFYIIRCFAVVVGLAANVAPSSCLLAAIALY